jgi:hypothetical protein
MAWTLPPRRLADDDLQVVQLQHQGVVLGHIEAPGRRQQLGLQDAGAVGPQRLERRDGSGREAGEELDLVRGRGETATASCAAER